MHGGNTYIHENIRLDFSSNCNVTCRPEVIEAALEGTKAAGVYPDIDGTLLREKTAERFSGRFACELQAEHVIPGNGASELIYACIRALSPVQTMLLEPVFTEYARACAACHIPVVPYELRAGDYELGRYFTCVINKQPKDSMLVLCNPNNPTGQLIEPELLVRILDICKRYGIYVLLDECFIEFTRAESMLGRLDRYPNLVILSAYTKTYAIPGLRLGFAFSKNQELLAKIKSQLPPWNISTPAMYAGIKAGDLSVLTEEELSRMEAEREFLVYELKKRGLVVYKSDANFIFFSSGIELAEKLLEQGILIRDCSDFVNVPQKHYRICVRTREENQSLLEAIDRIYKQEN